jgi:hypothetical protein
MHTSIHSGRTGNHPASPHAMVYGLLRALPGDRALLPPSPANMSASLTPASRRQDHTTWPSAIGALVKSASRVHRIPPRVRDDRDTPLEWDETGADMHVIWVGTKWKYFLLWDSTDPTTPNLARRARFFLHGVIGPNHCRHCEERSAKQSTLTFIAFPLSRRPNGLLRFARNDGT